MTRRRKDVLFVDKQSRLEGFPRNFNKMFHLTIGVSVAFASHLTGAMRQWPHR